MHNSYRQVYTDKCNGVQNCEDNSDEDPEMCKYYKCPAEMFDCGNGQCIHDGAVCDGVVDCMQSGADEDIAYGCSPNRSCPYDLFYFACGNGQCVYQSQVCDGRDHCRNNADEGQTLCNSNRECPPDHFSCGDGKCVPLSFLCQPAWGITIQCLESAGVDEQSVCHPNRTCPEGYLSCQDETGGCVHPLLVCDGYKNCYESNRDEDETTCANRECGEDQFACGDGQCVELRHKCDNKTHCKSGLDEDADLCGYPKPGQEKGTDLQELAAEGMVACKDPYFPALMVPEKFKCDGTNHCPNGGDESPDVCQGKCRDVTPICEVFAKEGWCTKHWGTIPKMCPKSCYACSPNL